MRAVNILPSGIARYGLILSMFLLIGCSGAKKMNKPGQLYFPQTFKSLYFGMPLSEFRKIRPKATLMEPGTMDFRHVYAEMKPAEGISNVVYYLDTEGDSPLYELIIQYENATLRDQAASRLLGAPNDGAEWAFQPDGKIPIRAWTFKEKLVIIGVVKGTEWDETEE